MQRTFRPLKAAALLIRQKWTPPRGNKLDISRKEIASLWKKTTEQILKSKVLLLEARMSLNTFYLLCRCRFLKLSKWGTRSWNQNCEFSNFRWESVSLDSHVEWKKYNHFIIWVCLPQIRTIHHAKFRSAKEGKMNEEVWRTSIFGDESNIHHCKSMDWPPLLCLLRGVDSWMAFDEEYQWQCVACAPLYSQDLPLPKVSKQLEYALVSSIIWQQRYKSHFSDEARHQFHSIDSWGKKRKPRSLLRNFRWDLLVRGKVSFSSGRTPDFLGGNCSVQGQGKPFPSVWSSEKLSWFISDDQFACKSGFLSLFQIFNAAKWKSDKRSVDCRTHSRLSFRFNVKVWNGRNEWQQQKSKTRKEFLISGASVGHGTGVTRVGTSHLLSRKKWGTCSSEAGKWPVSEHGFRRRSQWRSRPLWPLGDPLTTTAFFFFDQNKAENRLSDSHFFSDFCCDLESPFSAQLRKRDVGVVGHCLTLAQTGRGINIVSEYSVAWCGKSAGEWGRNVETWGTCWLHTHCPLNVFDRQRQAKTHDCEIHLEWSFWLWFLLQRAPQKIVVWFAVRKTGRMNSLCLKGSSSEPEWEEESGFLPSNCNDK